jgi:hypothetical protein
LKFVVLHEGVFKKAPPHLKSTDLLQEIHFFLEDGVNYLSIRDRLHT